MSTTCARFVSSRMIGFSVSIGNVVIASMLLLTSSTTQRAAVPRSSSLITVPIPSDAVATGSALMPSIPWIASSIHLAPARNALFTIPTPPGPRCRSRLTPASRRRPRPAGSAGTGTRPPFGTPWTTSRAPTEVGLPPRVPTPFVQKYTVRNLGLSPPVLSHFVGLVPGTRSTSRP